MQTELFHTDQFNTDKLTIDELFKRSRKYQGSDAFIRFFSFISKFKHYSRFNTMLVYLQNEDITFFGGTQFWKKKFNRKIAKEAQPYVILQPFGPVMLVYDVMETEGKESPEDFMISGLGSDPFAIKGKISSKTLDGVMLTVMSYGIKIKYENLSFFNTGQVTTTFKPGPPVITLKNGISFENNLAVLFHELAHLFLGHTGHPVLKHTSKEGVIKEVKLIKRNLSLTARELEAETVSFLIGKKLGLESKSAEYLATYIRGEKDLEEFGFELVIKTADRIEELFLKSWMSLDWDKA